MLDDLMEVIGHKDEAQVAVLEFELQALDIGLRMVIQDLTDEMIGMELPSFTADALRALGNLCVEWDFGGVGDLLLEHEQWVRKCEAEQAASVAAALDGPCSDPENCLVHSARRRAGSVSADG